MIRSPEMLWTRVEHNEITTDTPLLEMFMKEALEEGPDKHSPLIKLYESQVASREKKRALSMPSQMLRKAFQEGGTGFTEMGRLGLAMKAQDFISLESRVIIQHGFLLFADPAVTVTTKPVIVDAEE
jgi:hypothetical protein